MSLHFSALNSVNFGKVLLYQLFSIHLIDILTDDICF